VGNALVSGQESTLAESWNGTAWSMATTPNPATSTASYMASVQCTAASTCAVVGAFSKAASEEGTLAENEAAG
jgi:hypothetical protein